MPEVWTEPLPDDEPVVVYEGGRIYPCHCEFCAWLRAVKRLEAPYDRED